MSPEPSVRVRLAVLICHGKEDISAALDLHGRLTDDGYDPWVAVENMMPGQGWAAAIPAAVRTSDVVLVCLSVTAARRHGYAQRQIRLALDAAAEQRLGDAVGIVPVRLESCDTPRRLAGCPSVDYFEPSGYEQLTRILDERATRLGLPVRVTRAARYARSLAAPPSPPTKVNPMDGAEMIYVPPGPFVMGDDDQEDNPRHTVALSGYYVYKNPVTIAMYRRFCDSTERRRPAAPDWGWLDDHPIVRVSWNDAKAYCEWAGVSLPTEAQWEKAARGTDGRRYPWGDDFDATRLWCSSSAVGYPDAGGTHAVDGFPAGASPYGVLDMTGNVWEWCADWYDKDFWRRHRPDQPDPCKDTAGQYRVWRGGCWIHHAGDAVFRCAFRSRHSPELGYVGAGFRPVSV